jgi:ribosomal protein L16 Arg81 hydroxylase
MKLLEELINPTSIQTFYQKYWTREELHSKGSKQTRYIFSLEDFNRLMETHQEHLSYPVIRLIKNGKTLPESKYTQLITKKRQETSRRISLQKISENWRSGSTVSFNGLNNYSESLANFCKRLSSEFGESTQVNCYLTPKQNQGFDAHYDHHEIFILQIEGEKEWDVYGLPDTYPIVQNAYYDQGTPDLLNKRTYNLTPGDVFYIPRGMWHQAKTKEVSSMHLTVNINCNLNIDFISWLIEKIGRENVNFRKNLTSNFSLDSFNPFQETIKQLNGLEKDYKSLLETFNASKNLGTKFKLEFNN